MSRQTKKLYHFLNACGGNWRNTIYIPCREERGNPGYLLAADWNGRPVIMTIDLFRQLTDIWVDPDECCGLLTESAFESLFSQYLLWHTASNVKEPVLFLSRELSD